ncbi:MAG TPA: hypothetical protein VIG33_10220 [Pseudobdellovibrionaceae bacterium]
MQTRTLSFTFFALFCGILISSTESSAQSAQNLNTSGANPTAGSKPVEVKPFAISAGLSKSISLVNFQDGERQETHDLELMASYKWSLGTSLAIFTFSDDIRNPGNSDVGDIALAMAFNGWNLTRFKLVPSMTVVIPESKESRINNNLETALSGKLSAAIQERLLIPGFSFKGDLSFGRNIHRYETALDGTVLNKYASKQGLSAGYSIGIFSFAVDFSHINFWTYQDTLQEFFEHTEETSLALGEHFGFTLGHTNGGSVFKENGYASNYQLIDENNSLVYAKVSLQY